MIDAPLLARILAVIDRLSEVSGRIFSWFIAPLILGITYEVVMRYASNAPTIWSHDVAYLTCTGVRSCIATSARGMFCCKS